MSFIPLLTALGEAMAAAILFALSLVVAMAGIGLAGVLLALRRSLRGSLIGLGIAVIVFGVVAAASEQPGLGAAMGAGAFVAGFALVRRRLTHPDPIRVLGHRVVTVVIAGVALLTAGAVVLMWSVLIGGLGLGVGGLLVDHPIEALLIGTITIGATAVAGLAISDIRG